MKDKKTIVQRLLANADIDESEGCTAYVVAMEREAAERIKELEDKEGTYILAIKELSTTCAGLSYQLAEANKVIDVVDALITCKGRYHTAQWYQKMVVHLMSIKRN